MALDLIVANPRRRRKARRSAKRRKTRRRAGRATVRSNPMARRSRRRRRSRSSVRRRAVRMTRTTTRRRRRRARSLGVRGFRIKQVLSKQFLTDAAATGAGFIGPSLILDRFGAQVPAQLMTANVRPITELGVGIGLGMLVGKFLGARLGAAVIVGAGAKTITTYAARQFPQLSAGVSGLGDDLWIDMPPALPGGDMAGEGLDDGLADMVDDTAEVIDV